MKKVTEILYQFLSDPTNVDPEVFYQSELPELDFGNKDNANSWCPFHNPLGAQGGQTPSLSISRTSGSYKCHSCKAAGKDVVQFWQNRHEVTFKEALESVYSNFVHPVIKPKLVMYYHENLLSNTGLLKLLEEKRGINLRTIEQRHIGFDGERVTLPVRNQFGFWINIRRWDYTGQSKQKILNYQKGYGSIDVYPFGLLHNNPITICEGEWDALLLNQLGIPAITVTGGVGAWNDELNDFLKDKHVRICFDVNDKPNNVNTKGDTGQIYAQERAQLLRGIAASIKIIKLPLEEIGGDVTDYFHKHKHTKQDWDQLVEDTELFAGDENQKIIEIDKQVVTVTTLAEAAEARYVRKPVQFNALVQGKDPAPYALPDLVGFYCPKDDNNRCEHCPNKGAQLTSEQEKEGVEFTVAADEVSLPDYIFKSTKDVEAHIRSEAFYPKTCTKLKIEIKKFRNIEKIVLSPDSLYTEEKIEHVSRDAYYMGYGIQIGTTYECVSYPVQHPKTQKTIQLIKSAKSVQASFETFKITPEIIEKLKVFETDDPMTKMAEIYDHYAINGTRIFGRPGLHMALDWPFFSALSFKFCNELVHKGWADVLIIGDAQSGKGKISTWLTRFYRVGEICSAENTSKAGLIGGVATNGDSSTPAFGKIVSNNGKILFIDELSSLNSDIIKDMSRVRTEGIAEIVKIIVAQAQAKTRLVMIGNTKSGRPLSKYNFGIEAVKELIESAEDIARFDYAFGVAEDEVSSESINRRQLRDIESPYTGELSRLLIQWVWSRTVDQIVFRKDAEDLILREAIRLGKKYSAEIPLVQSSNIRIKLAKLGVMVAGRCFSHTPRGDKILVCAIHVKAAIQFLEEMCYDTKALSYNQFSAGQNDEHLVDQPDVIKKLINDLCGKAPGVVDAFIKRKGISLSDIQDYVGLDRSTAEKFKGQLVRHRCIFNYGDKYMKTAGFIELLKELKQHYAKHGAPKQRSF